MLIINIIDMGLNCMVVVSCRPSIGKLVDVKIVCSIIFLTTFEIHFKKRVIVTSASIPLLQIFLSEFNIMQVCFCWLLLELWLFLIEELRI